jgi:precorrin-6B methylase 2
MGRPGAGGSSGLGFGSGSLTNGAIGGARSVQVIASEGLTSAMVFTPIATAACGLTTIFAMATWASQGNRQMELVSRVVICGSTAE